MRGWQIEISVLVNRFINKTTRGLSIPICIVTLIVIAFLKNETKTTQDTTQNAYQNNFQKNNQQARSADFHSCPHCGAKIEVGVIYCADCANKEFEKEKI